MQAWQGQCVHNRAAWEGNWNKPQVKPGVVQSVLSQRNGAELPPPTPVLTQFRFLISYLHLLQ